MFLKVFGVAQIFIQVISTQISARDLASQNVLKDLANSPLAAYGRSRRQINNQPVGLPVNGNLPGNGLANGSPFGNGMTFGNFPRGNGLPNNFALNNGLPNISPISSLNFPFTNINALPQNRLLPNINGINNNGVPFNNSPNGLPGFNNVPNGLPGLNDVQNGLPGFNNEPNRLPGLNNVPNGLPSLNNMPNGLSNLNNLPMTNKFQNLINVPAGNNILHLNNLPAENSIPNPTGLPSFHILPCGGAVPSLPVSNGLPLNNFPNSNMLPINNKLPFFNNFQITEIGIGHGVADITRFPRNNKPDGNVATNINNFQKGNRLTQQENYKSKNGFSDITNTPSASALPTVVPVETRFSSANHFPISNGVANEAQNIGLNNGWPDVSDLRNCNEQIFVKNTVPLNNGCAAADNFPVNTIMPNANNKLVNAIKNGMPLSNGGYFNDILLDSSGMTVNMPETYVQYSDDNGFSGNNFQFGNVQVPDNKWHYEFVGTNGDHKLLPEGVPFFSNTPQTSLVSNNLSLAQELVKNLQIEGLGNMPFLNGLPVAGITETVTVLNGPYRK